VDAFYQVTRGIQDEAGNSYSALASRSTRRNDTSEVVISTGKVRRTDDRRDAAGGYHNPHGGVLLSTSPPRAVRQDRTPSRYVSLSVLVTPLDAAGESDGDRCREYSPVLVSVTYLLVRRGTRQESSLPTVYQRAVSVRRPTAPCLVIPGFASGWRLD